jgi:hypothetical protein
MGRAQIAVTSSYFNEKRKKTFSFFDQKKERLFEKLKIWLKQDGRAALHEVCRSPATLKEEVLARIAKRLIQSGCDVNLTSSSQVWACLLVQPFSKQKIKYTFLYSKGGFERFNVRCLS